MPAIDGVPVMDTELITEERRQEINAGLHLDIGENGEVVIVGGRTLTQGDYDELSKFLRVGDITIKEWFSKDVPDGYLHGEYRDCLPPEIVGRRPFRISPLPGHKPRQDEEGNPVLIDDLPQRKNMRYRLWLCATLGRTELGLPVGYEREPLYTGGTRLTRFHMVLISDCLRKMREIYEGENTYFLYQSWKRFEIFYNELEDIAPVGWFLLVHYNTMAQDDESDTVENFPPVEDGEIL